MLPSLAKPRRYVDSLQLVWSESVLTAHRQEKDDRIVSLGLHVVRNLLAIKDAVADGHTLGQKEELANLQVGGLDYVR
jgi:replication fork protection complex subunit Tof1/Swi1